MLTFILTFFTRRPWWALSLTTGVCLLLWVAGTQLQTRSGIDSVLDARGGQREAFERAREIGEIERTLFIDVEHRPIFSTEGLSLVRDLTDAFIASGDIRAVKSLTHSVMPVRRGFSFSFEALIPPPPWDDFQLAALEELCLQHPLIRNVMVSADGNRALVAVEYHASAFERSTPAELRDRAQEILDTFEQGETRLRMIGLPFAELEMREAVKVDSFLLFGGALLLAAVILRVAFLGWGMAGSLLLIHLIYLSILPGLSRVAGYQPEPFALALFPLLGAIQLTLLAHLGTALLRNSVWEGSRRTALERAIAETGKACLFATLTTMAGFLALTVSPTESVRELGFWGAAGVGTGFLFTFGPGVAVLAVTGGRRRGLEPSAADRRLRSTEARWRNVAENLAQWIEGHRSAPVAGALLLATIAGPGLLLLQPDVRLESFLPRGSQIEEAVRIADAEYGGLHVAQIDFDSGRAGGITERDFLEFVWEIHRRAESIPEVTAVYSYPQVLTVLNQVWRGGDPEALRLPDEPWLLGMFTGGLEAFDLPFLGAVADEERRTAFMILRMPSLSSARYLEIVEQILAAARGSAPTGTTIEAGGIVHEFLASDQAVVRAQLLSSLTVIAAVAVLLLVLWRNPVLMAKGLAVTLLPVGTMLGFAGYFGIPLNAITVMAGAIAAGIAVDDAVHFITCWRDVRGRSGDSRAAVAEAIFTKGPPIFFTSLILIGVFLLLGLSAFQPVAHLGLMTASALVLTLPAILILLPILLNRRLFLTADGRR